MEGLDMKKIGSVIFLSFLVFFLLVGFVKSSQQKETKEKVSLPL